MNLLSKEHTPFFYFITLVAIFRLLVAPHLGLGADEAHYLIYALNLDWSYYDHPPLVGWTQYIFTSIFGVDEFGSRISAISIGFFSSLFLYKLIYQIDYSPKKAFIGVLALHGAFIFNALFLMLMPDTLLFLFIIPIIFSVVKLEHEDSLKNWLFLGLLLGLAGLSKYTAILFIVPIVLYFVLKKRYDIFINPKILLSASTAVVIVSPVIYWNMLTGWESFIYQSNHVVGSSTVNFKGFLASLSAQFFTYNPFLVPLSFYGLYRSIKSKNDLLFLSALFGITLFIFFTYNSLYKTALPHWSALFYMLFIPIGVYFLYDKYTKYIKFSIGLGILLSSLIYLEVATKLIPLPDENSLHIDIYGFEKIMSEANKHIKEPQKEAIGVTIWTLASRAIVYNSKYPSDVYLLDKRHDQFDIWQKEAPLGKDMVVIDTPFAHKEIKNYMKCDSVQKLDAFKLVKNEKEPAVTLYRCTNYQGLR
ncbi:phospholipid carrier-dependent glycosyltransferase [Sulfurimonas aquatica]|uniref:Phospholipid carrier-dependent glycosyltransferase n=2 Tax=Sulfurimonas aquatica TaxID=2672570 RepID=A0A975GDV7_9BACT|nr:phospholipid carrier-dependent glycosyltransferase [Sulfurimonas aquatica]